MGCHETKSDAQDQVAAINANEDSAAASLAVQAAIQLSSYKQPLVELVTVPNVTVIEVGMDYPSMMGPITVTSEDLVDAVLAGQDPTIPAPRIKLGHTDPRYNEVGLYDALPNFGFGADLRLANSGIELAVDLIGVPKWLATLMPVAYPNKSIEGWSDWTAVSGKHYRFALTAIAMLGVVWPACMMLEETIPYMYGANKPDFIEVWDLEKMVEMGVKAA